MYNKKTLRTAPETVTFTHFSRGGWSIFASLKRPVRIGVLAVSMLGSVCIEKVEARQIAEPEDDAKTDETEMAEVTVAGSMAPLTMLQSARIVGVITRQQIEAAAVHTVNDLLKLASGVDVRQRGGFGIQTDISIDGGTFDQITLLLNGTNISNPHTGHLAADFPVALSDIERIEVLEGAASRVYGASAFGGAINIVTKTKPDTQKAWAVEAGAHGGSYATFGGDARVAFAKDGKGMLSLSGAYQRSDGATANSDFKRGNMFMRGEWTPAEAVTFDMQAGWSTKDYGANTFYSAAYPDQFESNGRYLVSIGATTHGRVRLRPEIYWNRSTDNFQLIRGTAKGENFHRTDVAGSHITLDVNWIAGRTAIGGEIRTEGIVSTNLGHPIPNVSSQPHIHGTDLRYSRRCDRTNLSFNVEHSIVLPRFTASVGLLANSTIYQQASIDGASSALRFYPGADIAYRPAEGWKLFASYNKGFRMPTFTDLYYKAPTHEGNSGLKAEESHSMQVGVTYALHTDALAFDAKVRAFYHRGTQMIDWVMYTADDVFHSANFDLDNMGAQATAALRFNGERAWVRRLEASYTYIHQQRRDDVAVWKSNYSMEYLRHKFVASLDHRIWDTLTATWTLRWQDRMGAYIKYEDATSTGELVGYSPYATLDLKIRWTRPHYELWVEGTNITNHTYYDLGNIPQPGIVALAGARVKF